VESTPASPPIAPFRKLPVEHQLLLPAPPMTRIGRAATVVGDRWNGLRNDLRLMAEDHMVATPIVGLAAGFLAGRILHAAFSRPRDYSRGW
jgi:hypothetical protein